MVRRAPVSVWRSPEDDYLSLPLLCVAVFQIPSIVPPGPSPSVCGWVAALLWMRLLLELSPSLISLLFTGPYLVESRDMWNYHFVVFPHFRHSALLRKWRLNENVQVNNSITCHGYFVGGLRLVHKRKTCTFSQKKTKNILFIILFLAFELQILVLELFMGFINPHM